MTTLCECYEISGACKSASYSARSDETPKAGELLGEAAWALAVPLALAMAVSFALPLAGIAGP